MDQISRPMLVALVAVVCFAAAWMTVLRPSAEGDAGGNAEAAAAPAAAAPAPSAPAAKEGVPHVDRDSDGQRAAPRARAAAVRPTTVLLFAGKGADDAVAREVVRGAGGKDVKVIVGTVDDVARHQDLLGGIEVLSLPTIVVVGPGGTARRIEGLPDAALLEQAIAEAG
jgi:hypothetical protein